MKFTRFRQLTNLALAATLAATVFGAAQPVSAETEWELSWVNDGGKWYAYDQYGHKRTGWVKDTNKCWYLLDFETAAMRTGWVAGDSTHWYYFNPNNGIMQYGWQTIGGKQYYLEKSGDYAGAMVKGDYEIGGTVYTFGADGVYTGISKPADNKNEGSTSNLSEKEILDLQMERFKEIVSYDLIKDRPFFKSYEIDIPNHFNNLLPEKMTTALIPLGSFDTDYYEIGKKYLVMHENNSLRQFIMDEIVNYGYWMLNDNVFFTEEYPKYEFDLQNPTIVTLKVHKDNIDWNHDYGANGETYPDYLDRIYELNLDTGLAYVTDYEENKYCIYNKDEKEKYECYDNIGYDFNHLVSTHNIDKYKKELYSTKETNNDYQEDREQIDYVIDLLLDNVGKTVE